MTNVKLYDGCDGAVRDACFLCLCSAQVDDDWTIAEITAPAKPIDGTVRMYACANSLHIIDDTGTCTNLAAGGGGTPCWQDAADPYVVPASATKKVCFACFATFSSGAPGIRAPDICTPCIALVDECWVMQSCLIFVPAGACPCISADRGGMCLGATSCKWSAMCSYAYNCPSDSECKCNFTPINCEEILDCYGAIPLNTWKWKGEDGTNIGFTSQDYNAHFSQWVSTGEGGISMGNNMGLRDAAIQALITRVRQLEDKIRRKKNE
jgi:hypothetical protein